MKIKKWLASLGLIGLFAVSTVSAKKDPEADRQAFVNYFENRHNGVEISANASGAYALNQAAYDEWLTIEEFPPANWLLEKVKTSGIPRSPTAKPIRTALTPPLKTVFAPSIHIGMMLASK